jgi:hypothetical protein
VAHCRSAVYVPHFFQYFNLFRSSLRRLSSALVTSRLPSRTILSFSRDVGGESLMRWSYSSVSRCIFPNRSTRMSMVFVVIGLVRRAVAEQAKEWQSKAAKTMQKVLYNRCDNARVWYSDTRGLRDVRYGKATNTHQEKQVWICSPPERHLE